MDRRSFIAAAGAVAALSPVQRALAQGSIPAAKLARLSVSSSTYRANYEGRFKVAGATPPLSHRTFPAYVKEKFGITKIELWDQQFGTAGTTFAECRAIRAAADAAGVQVVSVEVESTAPINAADADDRAQALAEAKVWPRTAARPARGWRRSASAGASSASGRCGGRWPSRCRSCRRC